MAEGTGISWTDATFNPWVGCSKVSPGCAHCYAETLVTGRMGRPGTWGEDGVRERTSEANWRKPLAWNRRALEGLLPDGSPNPDGHRPRVFCASLADVFEPRAEVGPWLVDLFDLIEDTPALDWLLLTKRPTEARVWLRYYYDRWQPRDGNELLFGRAWHGRDDLGWGVLPNVWIGTSIENARHTWRADELRLIPATVRFLSCEPLLGTLFPDRVLPGKPGGVTVQSDAKDDDDAGVTPHARGGNDVSSSVEHEGGGSPRRRPPLDLTGIDWVIVGGESGGPTSRPMHPDWAREIRDAVLACGDADRAALDAAFALGAPDDVIAQGIAEEIADGESRPRLHMKQWGSWAPDPDGRCDRAVFLGYDGRSVGRLTLDAAPGVLVEPAYRMGYFGAQPTSGGKLLDSAEWCEIPEPGLAVTPA